jgi:hypothetical protein
MGFPAPGLNVAGRDQKLNSRTPQFETRAHVLGGKAGDHDLDAGEEPARLVARLARRKGEKFRILLETRTHGASPVSTKNPPSALEREHTENNFRRKKIYRNHAKFTNENFTFQQP